MGSGPIMFPANITAVVAAKLPGQQLEEQRLQIQQLQREIQQFKSERQRAGEDQEKKVVDGLVQVMSSSFDKAAAYTNLIIVAGYGAFFGLWTLTKNDLPPLPSTLAAILILISAATFVFFEVFRMAYTTIGLRDLYGLINPEGHSPVNVMLQRMNEFQTRSRKLNLSFHRLWELVLLVCVSTGVLAVLLLFGALLYRLFTTLSKVI